MAFRVSHTFAPLLRLSSSFPSNRVRGESGPGARPMQKERVLALLLGSVSLYGVMAYAVARRTNEIGIRIALGARGADVIWMILKKMFLLVGAGIAIGLPVALACPRLVESMLYGLSTADPVTITSAIFVMGTVALLATFLPARRASKIDPMVALRYE